MITTILSKINLIKTSNNVLWNIFHKTLILSVFIHVNNFYLSSLRRSPTTIIDHGECSFGAVIPPISDWCFGIASLSSRQTLSYVLMTFSSNLDLNVRIVSCLQLFRRLTSWLLLFDNSATTAYLYFAEKHSVMIDSLNNRAANGDRNCRYCLTNHVGA